MYLSGAEKSLFDELTTSSVNFSNYKYSRQKSVNTAQRKESVEAAVQLISKVQNDF